MNKAQHAKQQIDQALEQLARDLESGRSDTLTAFLAYLGKFHRYSFGNVMLIMAQRPDATRVAGYRAWQQLGRQVRKGEKSITIIAPMLLKADRTDDFDESRRVIRFRAASVFDIAQTDGEDMPEFATVTGSPGELLDRLTAAVNESGITIRIEDLGSVNGVSMGGTILLDEKLDEAERFSVLAHEFAHELLHRPETDGEPRPDRNTRELEAEAVAYVVSSYAGLDVGTASSDYIQLHGGDTEQLSNVLDRVQKTSAGIITRLATTETLAAS